jgi:glutamate synthase domain-containing protein 3
MTITTAAGGQRIVLLTPTTTVTQVTSANKAVSDVAAGQTVTVVGTPNPDGSVTATRIIIGDVSLFGGRGGPGGPGGSAAPSSTP